VSVTKNVQQARINGLGFETREGGGNLHASGVWKRKKRLPQRLQTVSGRPNLRF